MTDQKSGFYVRYSSPRGLRKDHAAQLALGGMLVPWKRRPPAPNTSIAIRLQAPDQTTFEIGARVLESVPGRGFRVNFDPVAENRGRAALDLYMRGALFKRSFDAEPPTSDPESAPGVEPFGALASLESDDQATDPHMARPPDLELEDAALHDGQRTSIDAEAGEEDDEAYELETEAVPSGFTKPGPGQEYVVYAVKYVAVRDFAEVAGELRRTQRLALPFQEDKKCAGAICQLRLTLPGHNIYRLFGAIERITADSVVLWFDANNETYVKACLFIDSVGARNRMKNEPVEGRTPPVITRLMEKVPDEDPNRMPIRRRLQRMGMDDKINLALTGGREERMALAMDGNKAIHHYLLRNAKISLDEIAYMARLPGLNPDVLEKIAENPSYTQNPSVVKALVYNPKTPVQTAIRLLDRLPRPEVMNLAKRVNMNQRLVMAAKKKIEGKRW